MTRKPTDLASRLRRTKQAAYRKAVPHLVIIARAGTGKTTTNIEGIKYLKDLPVSVTPSPQQQAIWDSIAKSRGIAHTICCVAFNEPIAIELQRRVPPGCNAMTMHSMGFKAVARHFDLSGDNVVNQYRVQDIIAELLGRSIHEIRRRDSDLLKATEKLVSLCKMNLILSSTNSLSTFNEQLSRLAAHYDVDLNGQTDRIFDLVPRVLERCKDVTKDGCVDFADRIWLPIALDLNIFCYDLLLVDEAQDLNRCQQALALKAGRRLILCGDDRQAIYGWTGADSDSIPRMMKQLSLTDQGCEYLHLTVTRRCGKAIVREAQKIVPDFEAHESCCEGLVLLRQFEGSEEKTSYHRDVKDGDMILCRCNAPLVSECFKFLRQGRKANIQGRDVGQGLISTIRKLMKGPGPAIGSGPQSPPVSHAYSSFEIVDLLDRLCNWLHLETRKEHAKRNPSESHLIALQDKHDCIECFTEGNTTVSQVIAAIEVIFTDDKDSTGIRLSSVHKAKGLEAKRVFILQPKGAEMPHKMAKSKWQIEQEWNCLYIAITRAIEELIYVS